MGPKRILLGLFAALPAFADVDPPDVPKVFPPAHVKQTSADVRSLIKAIEAVAVGKEQSISAKLVLNKDNQLFIRHAFKYGWRAGDRLERTLVYRHAGGRFDLLAVLEGVVDAKSVIGDLTGDGISELIVSRSEDFRSDWRRSDTVFTYNRKTARYEASNLSAESNGGGGCPMESVEEKFSVELLDKKAIVAVVKTAAKTGADCIKNKLGSTTSRYRWDQAGNKFVKLDN